MAYVETAFACLERGTVIVPLRAASDRDRIAIGEVGEVVTPDATRFGWVEAQHRPRWDGDLALLSFTSGTERAPKAVSLTHRNLADVVQRLTDVMDITGEIREYVGVPVYHSFGFGRCRTVAAAGGKAFLPAGGFSPSEIANMLERGEINAISAVPSLWRILLSASVISPELGTRVRWIEIGSQAMSRAEKLQVRELFPCANIVQHYGLTEASRSTFLRIHDASPAELDSVGEAAADVEIRIADDGRIRIGGPHVASRIYHAGRLTDPRDADGLLTTSDLGELRGGFLYYQGRADDVINCGGLKLSPDALEARMRELLGQNGELCVCRVPDALRGDGILVVAPHTNPASDLALSEAVAAAALELGVQARGATHVMRVEQLSRTATGKVQRRGHSQEFIAARGEPPPAAASAAADLRAELRAITAAASIADGDTFTSLGGDSLGYIQAGLAIQRRLGYLPTGWENLSIAELEVLPVRERRGATVETSVLLRALAILGIVINHSGILSGLLNIDGGAWSLLIPSGYSFARFQLQRVVAQDSPWPALGTAPRIFLAGFLFVALLQLHARELTLSTLLFYGNLVDPSAGHGVSYWFLDVLLQIYLLCFAACAWPFARKLVRRAPLPASLIACAACVLASAVGPWVWNTDHLFNLVPHKLAWLFAGGACLYYVRDSRSRALATLVLAALVLSLVPALSVGAWVLAGGAAMIWIPQVSLPALPARVFGALASASLYIYLTHETTFRFARRISESAGSVLAIVTGLTLGIIVWLVFDRAWDLAARLARRVVQAR